MAKAATKNSPPKPTPTPTRPKHLAEGRWYGDFAGLSPAEERLVAVTQATRA